MTEPSQSASVPFSSRILRLRHLETRCVRSPSPARFHTYQHWSRLVGHYTPAAASRLHDSRLSINPASSHPRLIGVRPLANLPAIYGTRRNRTLGKECLCLIIITHSHSALESNSAPSCTDGHAALFVHQSMILVVSVSETEDSIGIARLTPIRYRHSHRYRTRPHRTPRI